MPIFKPMPLKAFRFLKLSNSASRKSSLVNPSMSADTSDDSNMRASPALRISVEVLLVIFEFVIGSNFDNVHLFEQSYRYRITSSRLIRPLELVCRSWRNVAKMMRFCMSSHPSFEGLTQRKIGYKNDLEVFINFMQHEVSIQGSQVKTVYINHQNRRETPRNDQDVRLLQSLHIFLPRLTTLTEFACHMFLNAGEFDLLTSTAGNSLRVLAIQFDYQIQRATHMFSRLRALEDLSVSLKHYLTLQKTGDVPDLPQLYRLELSGKRSDLEFMLTWMSGLRHSNLKILRLSGGIEPTAALQTFFKTCCRNLMTLGINSSSFTGPYQEYSITPNLRHLEFGLGCYTNCSMVQSLPASVSVVTFVMSATTMDFLSFLKFLLVCISHLPEDHALCTFRLKGRNEFLYPTPRHWTRHLAQERMNREPRKYWEDCLETAEQIERKGKIFTDENSLPITDYLRATFLDDAEANEIC